MLISIHALREEGDPELRMNNMIVTIDISIHALREEGDQQDFSTPMTTRKFLSTPSARRATECKPTPELGRIISIHALREEGDLGEPVILFLESEFLSTPSARRATRKGVTR